MNDYDKINIEIKVEPFNGNPQPLKTIKCFNDDRGIGFEPEKGYKWVKLHDGSIASVRIEADEEEIKEHYKFLKG